MGHRRSSCRLQIDRPAPDAIDVYVRKTEYGTVKPGVFAQRQTRYAQFARFGFAIGFNSSD